MFLLNLGTFQTKVLFSSKQRIIAGTFHCKCICSLFHFQFYLNFTPQEALYCKVIIQRTENPNNQTMPYEQALGDSGKKKTQF